MCRGETVRTERRAPPMLPSPSVLRKLLQICNTLLMQICNTLLLQICNKLLLQICNALLLQICNRLLLQIVPPHCATTLCHHFVPPLCATTLCHHIVTSHFGADRFVHNSFFLPYKSTYPTTPPRIDLPHASTSRPHLSFTFSRL